MQANMLSINDFTRYRSEMIKIAMYYGATAIQADDIVQESFIKLMDIEKKEGNLDRITYKGKPNTGYLFAIVRSQTGYYLKEEKKYEPIPNEYAPEYEDKYCEKEYNEHLNFLMNSLNDVHWYYRKVFEVYCGSNVTYRELAKQTGISVRTLFLDVKYVKNKIKKEWQKESQKNKKKKS